MYNKTYSNKKVIITGNTGFKGSWLSVWLIMMGAKVIGISDRKLENPSMYSILDLESSVKQYYADVRDIEKFKEIIISEKPDFIFHFAAQALVAESYLNPYYTLATNAGGTINLLEIIKNIDFCCNIIFITSDKCYKNVNQVWGYKETDILGDSDPYSCSKALAELAIKSYYDSFISKKNNIKIAIARAGNVIGGGDWAANRIIPDCIRSWSVNKPVLIRNEMATRPWQHVLEPLNGYLLLGVNLYNGNKNISGEVFNFGPDNSMIYVVKEVIQMLFKEFCCSNVNIEFPYIVKNILNIQEPLLLKICSDKAFYMLKWKTILSFEQTISFVGEWYNYYYNHYTNMFDFTIAQINNYCRIGEI